MTDAATDRDTEFVTDAELIRRLGVPERVARATLKALDQSPRSGFPPRVPIWGDRRHWPSVQDYLRRTCGSRLADLTNRRVPHA